MTLCEFQHTGQPGYLHCPFCRTTVRSDDPPERTHRKCCAKEPIEFRLGLGDVVAFVLSRCGAELLLSRLGFDMTLCGCKRRQARLNRVWNAQTVIRRWRALRALISGRP